MESQKRIEFLGANSFVITRHHLIYMATVWDEFQYIELINSGSIRL
jgi:hypothetical protein